MVDETDTVVMVTPTIGDGTVVRWYVDEPAAEAGNEFMSASRNGVLIQTYLGNVPEGMVQSARDIHQALTEGREVGHAATHRRTRLLGGSVEPIVRVRHDLAALEQERHGGGDDD